MPPYLDHSIAELKQFEGCVPWMYRDTAGNVTVGVGLMLPDPAAACALPFLAAPETPTPATQAPATHPSATQAQIATDFARVHALPPGHLPDFYKSPTSPELSPSTIDARLLAVLTGFESTLRTRLPGYDALPDGIKLALLDMAYNLGPEGMLSGYPHMLRAIQQHQWQQAAAQCLRHGIGDARNAWTRQQLLSAVVATIRAAAESEAEAIRSEATAAKSSIKSTATRWLRKLRRALRL